MKNLLISFTSVLIITSCSSGQNNARNQAEKIKTAIVESSPGTIPTAEGGWAMTAKVNGKAWTATSLMPPEAAGRIIGYYNKEYIGLPYNKQNMRIGKIALGEAEAADIFFIGVGLSTTKNGEIEIIHADEQKAEGKFYFTCVENSTGKLIEVTDGYFKIFMK